MQRSTQFGLVLASFVAGLGSGCGGELPPAGAPEPEPLIVQVDASPEAEPRLGDQIVARALRQVERIRELPSKGPVRGRVIERGDMVEHVRRKLKEEVPSEVVVGTREILSMLGLVPVDFRYEESLATLLEAQLAGFYETTNKTMYLAADLEGVERRATLSHELVHALQDQHFDLDSKVKFAEGKGDEQAAIHALAEGDATSAMLDDVLEPTGRKAIDLPDELIGPQVRAGVAQDPSLEKVPSIMRTSIVAPYVDGVVFVHSLRRRGGWAAVDAVWRNPPDSTEQILHPEKMHAREKPERVPIPEGPPKGPKKRLYADVMGEQSVRLVLEEWLPRKQAETAASDWAGDYVAVFGAENQYAMAWHIRYDDKAAADRGYAAFRQGIGSGAATTTVCVERADRGPVAVTVRGREVVLVAGPYTRREPSGATSAGTCAQSKSWAAAVAKRG